MLTACFGCPLSTPGVPDARTDGAPFSLDSALQVNAEGLGMIERSICCKGGLDVYLRDEAFLEIS